MPQVSINYVTTNRVEIPIAEILRLLQPLLPPETVITGYHYDGGRAVFTISLQETEQQMTVDLQ